MEQFEFQLHPSLIKTLITDQTGSLDRAVLEAVQNSMDARATEIYIVLEAGHLHISDDGIGFADEKSIHDNFGTFGRPHTEEEAKIYGTFRMGRGQLMSHGKCLWSSNEFRIETDYRHAIGYKLRRGDPVKGCMVAIELYEPTSLTYLQELQHRLRVQLKYVSTPVYLNGVKINIDVVNHPWTHRGKWFVADLSHTWGKDDLRLYNMGIHVCDNPLRNNHLRGVVVSTAPLSLNFARTAVKDSCPIWHSVAEELRTIGEALLAEAQAKDRQAKKKKGKRRSGPIVRSPDYRRLSARECRARYQEIFFDDRPAQKYDDGQPLFLFTPGRFISAKKLLGTVAAYSYGVCFAGDQLDAETAAHAERLMLALPLRPALLSSETGNRTLEPAEFVNIFNRNFRSPKRQLLLWDNEQLIGAVTDRRRREFVHKHGDAEKRLVQWLEDLLTRLDCYPYYWTPIITDTDPADTRRVFIGSQKDATRKAVCVGSRAVRELLEGSHRPAGLLAFLNEMLYAVAVEQSNANPAETLRILSAYMANLDSFLLEAFVGLTKIQEERADSLRRLAAGAGDLLTALQRAGNQAHLYRDKTASQLQALQKAQEQWQLPGKDLKLVDELFR